MMIHESQHIVNKIVRNVFCDCLAEIFAVSRIFQLREINRAIWDKRRKGDYRAISSIVLFGRR